MSRDHYWAWRTNETINYMCEYLLSCEENEEERTSIKKTIETAKKEAVACRNRYLNDLTARTRDWERKKLNDELEHIKKEAIAKAEEEIRKKKNPLLIRNHVWYLVSDKHFVIRDNNVSKPVEFIDYDRLEVSGSSSSSASGFISSLAQSIDEIRIEIQPEERMLYFERQQYEDEFDSFLEKLQLKVYEANSK